MFFAHYFFKKEVEDAMSDSWEFENLFQSSHENCLINRSVSCYQFPSGNSKISVLKFSFFGSWLSYRRQSDGDDQEGVNEAAEEEQGEGEEGTSGDATDKGTYNLIKVISEVALNFPDYF